MNRALLLSAVVMVGCVASEVDGVDDAPPVDDAAVDEPEQKLLPCTSGRSQDRFSCGICMACLAYPRESPGGRAYSYPSCPYEQNAGVVCINATTNECHDSVCDP